MYTNWWHWIVALACLLSPTLAEETCRFPVSWVGQWFWKEVFNITETVLGSQGRCLEMSRNKYLIQTERGGRSCYICVVIFQHHKNILEFKESPFCNERASLREMCAKIGGDDPLHTMVRVSSEPVPCPFRGAFTFDYRRSGKVCDEPISRLTSCSDPSQMVLHHQACPDVAGAERIKERVTCLATWRSFNAHFMFARLDSVKIKTDADRYRCFIYRHFDNGSGQQGYHVVQSGDSTCQGLQSISEGPKVMNFYSEPNNIEKCLLPGWLTKHHEWHSMDSRQRYHIFHKNHSIRVSDQRWVGGQADTAAPGEATKLVCSRLMQVTEDRASLVLHHSRGCTTGYQCSTVYRRDKYVVEIKMGEVSPTIDAACRYFDEERHNFTTLIASSHPAQPCPYLGRHAVIGVRREGRTVRDACSGGFNTLVVGCSTSDTLQMRSDCPHTVHSTEYRCHGSWEENGTHYLVASPVIRSSTSARRVCFVSMATSQNRLFSTQHAACYRDIRPGQEGLLAFNVTINGDCRAEASTSGVSCLLSTPASLLLALTVLLMAPR